ncbi:hypothetical protein [Nocardia brasiliensis]|uniref:phage terminase small subunit n=1 Tax=Nocardia brasiliensis TaxID=37326 RepID=UPI002455267A|nr:hypothetical protein [Nocardia brasiliensis]
MPGPAPKRNPRRRNVGPEWRSLPAEGRTGAAPKWPTGRSTAAQREIWQSLWETPQALAWESLGWTRVVARYAQVLARCDSPKAPASILAEARQLEDRLGLSPMSMRRLQWEITEAPRGDRDAQVTSIADYRAL